jgi:hypothetical protein
VILLVAGMPRSGSMWTYNVARALLTCDKKVVLPRDIPPDETSLIEEAFSSPPEDNVFYCIKSHFAIKPNLLNTRIIFNYRDVRESMLSFMRFMHCDFERGLKVAESMMSLADFYFEQHPNNILRLRYERIVHEPVEVIEEINQFLDLHVTSDDIHKISERFSKENIKKLIDSFNSMGSDTPALRPELQKDFELIPNLDGSFRIYDKKTAFQSNHITESGARWRTELTEEQKNRLMKLSSKWLTKYHFAL